jgi:hypothetical protein
MLEELCKKHKAHKGEDEYSKHFMRTYERHFEGLRLKPLSILEIGIQSGGSLRMWAEYFENSVITGVDIKDKCKQHEGRRIKVKIGDQSNAEFLKSLGQFDIVIDDGGHMMKQQRVSFKVLWPCTRKIYVIEDLETSYWPQFKGGYGREGTTIGMLKGLVDFVNFRAVKHKRAEKYREALSDRGIASIHFYPSICFIER